MMSKECLSSQVNRPVRSVSLGEKATIGMLDRDLARLWQAVINNLLYVCEHSWSGSTLKSSPSCIASSSVIAQYDDIYAFTSALLSGQPFSIVSLSACIMMYASVALRSFFGVVCPIGRCLVALIYENCSCLPLER